MINLDAMINLFRCINMLVDSLIIYSDFKLFVAIIFQLSLRHRRDLNQRSRIFSSFSRDSSRDVRRLAKRQAKKVSPERL